MLVHVLPLLIVVGLPLTAQTPLQPAGDSARSIEKEVALGRQLADQVRREFTPLDSTSVQNYVERLGERIAPQISRAGYPFVFSVIADDACSTIHEPTALPGGYIFVPAALFLAAHEEAEFAGMLAHAMAHTTQQYRNRKVNQGQNADIASIPLIFVGGCNVAVPKAYLTLHRANEEEADARALEATARAGFDPLALVRYVERVQPQESAERQGAFSLLPDRNERVAKMQALSESLHGNYGDSGLGFNSVQDEVSRLMSRRSPTSKKPPTLLRPGSR